MLGKQNISNKRIRLTKELTINFVISMSAILFLYSILFYYVNYKIGAAYTTINLIVFLVAYYLTRRFPYSFYEIVRIVIIWAVVMIYLMTIVAWDTFPFIFFWYFPVIIAHLITKPSYKATIYWFFGILAMSLSAPFVSMMFKIRYLFNLNPFQVHLVSYATIFFNFYLITFLVYYINIFHRVDVLEAKAESNFGDDEEEEEVTWFNKLTDNNKGEYNYNKLSELYARIEQYFNDTEPFKDPDFTINKLAIDLNTNVTYISRALNRSNNINFKTYLNQHRIKFVKDKLNRFEHEKYTLRHIYTNAGFINQSTFNRVFREIEEMTPSEYIDSLKKEQIS